MGSGRVLVAALAGIVGVSAVSLISGVVDLIRPSADEGFGFADGWAAGLGLGFLGVFILTGVVWMVWQYQAHANLAAMGPVRFRPAAVWWFVVPVATLFMPYLAVAELAKSGEDRPRLRQWWWGAYLALNATAAVAAVVTPFAQNPATGTWLSIGVDLVAMTAAVLAINVVGLVSAALTARREALSWPAGKPNLAVPARLGWGMGAAGLATASGLLFGLGLPPVIESIESVELPQYGFDVGTCFDERKTRYPEVTCDEPHDGEVFALIDHPDQLTYPGEERILGWAEPICYARFDDYTGLPYETSPLEFDFLFPSAAGWAGGDRQVVCFLRSPTGEKLTAPVGTGVEA
ncbi:MAG: DUF4328 domain-containing protein [Actinomycetota bacterium]